MQNLAISGVTICLFLLAISNDFYGKLQVWVNGESWVQAGERMRDIGIELVIRPETASAYSLDNILTFGFFASLGLSAFAFQQSRRPAATEARPAPAKRAASARNGSTGWEEF